MQTMVQPPKTAAYWLDRAIHFESVGDEPKARMALNAAIKADDVEHAADPKTASLPRK